MSSCEALRSTPKILGKNHDEVIGSHSPPSRDSRPTTRKPCPLYKLFCLNPRPVSSISAVKPILTFRGKLNTGFARHTTKQKPTSLCSLRDSSNLVDLPGMELTRGGYIHLFQPNPVKTCPIDRVELCLVAESLQVNQTQS